MFPIITTFFPATAIIWKLLLAVVIVVGGVALSLVCAPELAPPPNNFRVYLPCNFAGFPYSPLVNLKGFKVEPNTETSPNAGNELNEFGFGFFEKDLPWQFDDDDRINGPTGTQDGVFPVLGSFRDSIYTESSGGERLGYTTWYAAESSLLWIQYQIGTILSLVLGILLAPKAAASDKKWIENIALPLLEIILGVGFALIFAFFGNYKTLIAKNDLTGGTIAHPVLRQFTITKNSDSHVVLNDDQKEILGPDFKLYPLGPNEIAYKGKADLTGNEDKHPAKFFFNVVDTMPPYLGFGEKEVVVVEANAHWGFVVEPKEWKKMGFNEFLPWDNCNVEPRVDYTGKGFLPMALTIPTEDKRFRIAQDKYDEEFRKDHNTAAARQSYLDNVSLTENDKEEFKGIWRATDHPEGYSVYEGGFDPSSLTVEGTDVSSIEVGDEHFLYNDTDIRNLIEVQAMANQLLADELKEEGGWSSAAGPLGSGTAGAMNVALNSLEVFVNGDTLFTKGNKLKGIVVPGTCDDFVDDPPMTLNDGLICGGGLVGSAGYSVAQGWYSNKYFKKVAPTLYAATLDDRIKNLNNVIGSLKKEKLQPDVDTAAIDRQIGQFSDELADSNKLKGKLQLKKGAFVLGGKAIAVGIAVLSTFVDPPPGQQPPPTETVDGLKSFWNQTVVVIDTTPPDVLVPGFAAVEVDMAPATIEIDPPLIFDVADPSPDLFHNYTGTGKLLDNNICHAKGTPEQKCGWIPLGDDDSLKGDFELKVTNVGWFGEDFSENQSPIRAQIVNVKITGSNELSVALDQNYTAGGFDLNPTELTIEAEDPDQDPVLYLVESNPNEGVLKSPLDPVFQNKIREAGDTGSLRGIEFVNPTNGSPDFVYFPDSKNNRVMKIFTEGDDSISPGHVELGFTFSNGTELPTGILPLDISPRAITAVDDSCPLTYMIGDWSDEKIYKVQLENCQVNSTIALVTDFFDIKGLFTDPQYFESKGNNTLYVSDAGLGSIIKTSLSDISNANSLNMPTDVLSLSNDEAWVVDSGNTKIIKFDVPVNEKLEEKSFPHNSTVTGIAANATHLFVSHERGGKISIINQADIDDSIQVPQMRNVQLGKFEGIAVNNNEIYTTDSKFDQIHILSHTGNLTTSFGGHGSDLGLFDNPTGILVNGENLFVADNGNDRIVKINLGDPFFEDDYSNSTNWQTFGTRVTVNDSSSGVLKFDNVSSGDSTTFSGTSINLDSSLPQRSWTANFTLETGTNTDNSFGYIWMLTNQTMTNPDTNPLNALGVILDSSKLFIYSQNSTVSLVSSIGVPIENNTSYQVILSRNTEEQTKLTVSTSGMELAPSPILNITDNVADLSFLQHSNNNKKLMGNSLNFTIDNTAIEPVKFSWLGSCLGGPDCIGSTNSNGFLCTDDTCVRDDSPGIGEGQFDSPLGVSFDGTNFFVTDSGNKRVQIFNASGDFIEEFGDFNQFILPSGISTDNQGKIYVTDTKADALKVFQGTFPFNLIHEITIDRDQDEFLKIAKQFQLSTFDIEVNAIDMDPSTGEAWVLDRTTSNQTKLFNLKNPSNIGNVIEGIDLGSLGLEEPTYFSIDDSGKFIIIDRLKDGGSAIEFEIDSVNDSVNFIKKSPLYPKLQNPVGIEIEDEFVYISDWTKGHEKIVKFERNHIFNDTEPAPEVFLIPNLVSNPQDIGFTDAVNPCLSDERIVNNTSSPENVHCDSPSENKRIIIADKDDDGLKIISFRTDKGIIDNKKIIEDNQEFISSIEYGVNSQEGTLFALATNKTLFSYDPWDSKALTTIFNFSKGSLNPDSFAFNPLPFGSLGNFTDGTNELNSPRGMVIGPIDNNLYVASSGTNLVKKYNGTTGEFIENFVDSESLSIPYGIAFHPETNNLFVSNFGDGCIREYDRNSGEYEGDIQCSEDWGMAEPKGIAFDSQGLLYSTAYDQNMVVRFNLTLNEIDELNLPEKLITAESNHLNMPDGLAFDNDDNLYIANPDEVLKFDSEGNFLEVFANSTIVSNPIGLYFDPANEIMYISNNIDKKTTDDSIKKIDLEGNLISTISGKDVKSPYYITMDSSGNILTGNELEGTIMHFGENDDNIYVADWGNKEIVAFTNNGIEINKSTINLNKIGLNETLQNPGEVSIDSNGNLYITDHNGTDGRIVVVDRIEQKVLKTISLSNIEIDRRPCIEIAGEEDPALCRLEDGQIVQQNKTNTSAISLIPTGLSIDSDDNMFLADWENNRIVRTNTDAEFIDLYKFNNTFADPADIAISLDQKNWTTNDGFPRVVVDENMGNHKIRFSVLDVFDNLSSGDLASEVKSLNYFSILQEKRDFPDEIKTIEGLARCVVDSCKPLTGNSEINDFTRNTYSLMSSSNGTDIQIAITNADTKRFINFYNNTSPNDIEFSPDTIPLEFSMIPEGVALFDNDQKLGVTDWNREVIRSYDITGDMQLFEENIIEGLIPSFPATSTLEFSDIDIDGDKILIADNFEVRVRQIDIASTPVHVPDPRLAIDQFVFMSSIAVNERDELYLLSKENSTLGNYNFRGEIIPEDGEPAKFESGVHLNPTTNIQINFTNIDLTDFAVVSEESGDIVYVLSEGFIQIDITEPCPDFPHFGSKCDVELKNPDEQIFSYTGNSGAFAYGEFTDFTNLNFDEINWVFFQKNGRIFGSDTEACPDDQFTFFNSFCDPRVNELSSLPAPKSIAFDDTNNKLYFDLDSGDRIAAFDTANPTCSNMSTLLVPDSPNDIFFLPEFHPLPLPHDIDNVLLCGSLTDKKQSTISGASIEDIAYLDNQLFLVDDLGHKVHKVNITNGLGNADSYSWMGKCETGTDCNGNDMTSKGFSCKMTENTTNTFESDSASCDVSGPGDFNGQFRNPTELSVDLRIGDVFTTDFPINLLTEETNPRVQKFSDKGFFIEDFISTLSRPELTNDPELLTDQSAGFFDNDNIVGIAKASNFFYAADGRKLHFFDTNPFETAVVDKNLNMSFANVSYQFFIEEGKDSFQFKVSDGFNQSDAGTVFLDIHDTDCDDDGYQNSVDFDDDSHGCPDEAAHDPLFEDLSLLGFYDGTTFGFINSTNYNATINPITIRDEPSPDGIFIQSDVESQGPVEIVMCDGEYRFNIEAGDRVLVKCDDSEVKIIRGQNIEFFFFDDEGRESATLLGYLDRLVYIPEGPSFTSLSLVSLAPKNMTVSFNGEQYHYVDILQPEKQLVVDTAPPDIVCPPPLTLQADVIEGIHRTKSNTNNTNTILEFIDFVTNSTEEDDNGNLSRDVLPTIANNVPTILPVGSTIVSFNATDGIGNQATCSQTIKVLDTIAPEVVLVQGEYSFTTPEHDDVFVFNFKEEVEDQAEIFDKRVSWSGNDPGAKALVFDDDNNTSKRRPMCLPQSGTEFTVNTTPVGCEGFDLFLNAGFTHFNMTVSVNAIGVIIDEAIASGPGIGTSKVDSITIRFSHETNTPPAQSKDQILNFLDFGGKSLGANYSGYYQNPSTLVINLDDPSGSDQLLPGPTMIKIKPGADLHSASGILNSSSIPVTLTGSFEKPRTPFITDFIANDPMMDDIGSAKTEDEKMTNMAFSSGDVLTIKFSDPTNKAGFGNEILNKTEIDSMFEFSTGFPGEDYVGSWLNSRTFLLTIKEMPDYSDQIPLLGVTTVKAISADLKNVDETSESSDSVSWPLQGSFGRFATFKNVVAGFTLATTQPSGIVTEITFPEGGSLSSLSQVDGQIDLGKSPRIDRVIGNVLDIQSSETCEDGCDLKFTYTKSDLEGITGTKIAIVHDSDTDRRILVDEILDTEVVNIGGDTFTATAKIFSLSNVALTRIGGGSGSGGQSDSSAPDIQDFTYSGGSGGYSSSGIGFSNDLETIVAQTGNPFTITLTVYEDMGLQALKHISLYMNLIGFNDQVHESDTYVRWDKGFPVSVRDPHGYFTDADVKIFEVGDKIQVVFEFEFARPMETSDVIIRTWDNSRNSWDSNFPDLLTVTGSHIFGEPIDTIDLGDLIGFEAESSLGAGNYTSPFPEGFLERWSTFSSGTVTDAELLVQLGLEGDYIPEWFKNTTAKWFMEEKISEQEFVDALRYMANNLILFAN